MAVTLAMRALVVSPGGSGGEETSFRRLYRYVWVERLGFAVVLVMNRVRCLHPTLELGMLFRRSHSFMSQIG